MLATATHDLIQTVTRREQCTPQVVPSLTQQSLCTHAPTGHVAETTGHITETTGNITETTGHITETTGHITETTGHITETTGQVTETTGQVTETTGQAAKKILERVNNCSALIGGLCIVTVAMAFGLVCMVSLWVRSCYRRATFPNSYYSVQPRRNLLSKELKGLPLHVTSRMMVHLQSALLSKIPPLVLQACPLMKRLLLHMTLTVQEGERNNQVRGKEDEREWQKEETVSEKVEREGASGYSNL